MFDMKKLVTLFFILPVFFSASFGQWTQQVSNTANDLTDVFFLNDSVGFVTGKGGTFLKTIDRGENWELSVINSSDDLNAVFALNEDTIFAGGNINLYKSIDGGINWTIITSQFHVYELKFFSSTVGFLKASWEDVCYWNDYQTTAIRYKYYRTLDGGNSWQLFDLFPAYSVFESEIDIVTADTGYIGSKQVGFWFYEYPCWEMADVYFYKTTDGGVTWQGLYAYDYISDVAFINGSDGFSIVEHCTPFGNDEPADIYRISQGGEHYSAISSIPDYSVDKFFFANLYEGYYIKDDRIMKTTTQGMLWNEDYSSTSQLTDMVLTHNFEAYVTSKSGIILHNSLDPITTLDSLRWISLDNDSLKFPLTNINGDSQKNLLLKSSGTADITVNLKAPDDFLIKPFGSGTFTTEISNLTIKAQHETIITVSFRPSQNVDYNSDLIIETNAFDDTIIYIPLIGKGACFLPQTIDNDSIFCYDTILVFNSVTINPGNRVTFCPGTVVLFKGKYFLSVKGSLRALGNPGENIVFTAENQQSGWSGIRITSEGSADSTILSYCRIEYGKSDEEKGYTDGGGISITGNDLVVIDHCEILNCYAVEGYGGGIFIQSSSPAITNCNIHHNYGNVNGGGIALEYSKSQLVGNIFHHNITGPVEVQAGGWAIFSEYSSPLIFNNTIYSNEGGISLDFSFEGVHPRIIQNLIFNNYSIWHGTGIRINYSNPYVLINTICNNSCSGTGGGISPWLSEEGVYSGNIIFGNKPDQVDMDSEAMFSYCDIEGGWASGQYIISSDPLFIHPSPDTGLIDNISDLNWSLLPASGCVNNGIVDTTGLDIPLLDFAGYPRIYDGRMDIGAYESHFYKQLLDTIVCIGDTFTLSVLPSGEGPFSFEWTHNGVLTPQSESNILFIESASLEDSGSYQSHVICPEGDFYSNKGWLSVGTTIPQILNQPEGGLVKEGESIILSLSAIQVLNYQWYLNDSAITDANDYMLTIDNFSKLNQGAYKCWAENHCGGIFSAEAILQLDPSFIAENSQSSLYIYPNPASTQLTVSGQRSAVELAIYDLYGREVMKFEKIRSIPYQLDISGLQDGMYVLRLMSEDGQSVSVKFLKISE
jgi:hypothetical protein